MIKPMPALASLFPATGAQAGTLTIGDPFFYSGTPPEQAGEPKDLPADLQGARRKAGGPVAAALEAVR